MMKNLFFRILCIIILPVMLICSTAMLCSCDSLKSRKVGQPQDDEEIIVPVAVFPNVCISLFDDENEVYNLSDVDKENYVKSKVSINNTEEKNTLNEVDAEFKGRGNGSWIEDKKGYKIKFNKKTSLFGREKNKHWVLIPCSNFDDKTLFKNYLAYNLTNAVFSNIEYTTNANWVNLYVNEEYRGVYLVCEHVRVGTGRVDIESEFGELDTGYLIEYDAYAEGTEGIDYFEIDGVKYPFTVHSPDPEDCEGKDEEFIEQYRQQVAFIQEYTANTYAAALNHDFETFSTYADVDSFVDMYILHEYFKNMDTGWSSFYLYKKPSGKIYAGPAWDFDITAAASSGNASPEGIYVAGSVLETSPIAASELFIALYNTEEFKDLVVKRWNELSTSIKNFINEKLDQEFCETIKFDMAKNFVLWDKISLRSALNNWVNSVNNLRTWLNKRITWLNEEWSATNSEE